MPVNSHPSASSFTLVCLVLETSSGVGSFSVNFLLYVRSFGFGATLPLTSEKYTAACGELAKGSFQDSEYSSQE